MSLFTQKNHENNTNIEQLSQNNHFFLFKINYNGTLIFSLVFTEIFNVYTNNAKGRI